MRPVISLLLPTRERPELLKRLFDSIVATADALSDIEVVLYLDEDDTISQTIEEDRLSIVAIVGRRTRMGEVTNRCYRSAHGRYLMLLNDDVVFRTFGWDKTVIEAFAHTGDDIALVYGNDLDKGRTMATFPFLSKTMLDLVGQVCPGGYFGNYIDVHLMDIFAQLGTFGYDRVVYLDEVIFEHLHYRVGKGEVDSIYIRRHDKAGELLLVTADAERRSIARQLVCWIEKNKGNHNDMGKVPWR